MTSKSYDKSKLSKAIAELHGLEKEIDAKPGLADTMQKSSLQFWLKTIKDGSGVK